MLFETGLEDTLPSRFRTNETNDYIFEAGTSSASCAGSVCTFTVNFWRKFDTADALDQWLYKDGPWDFHAYSWFYIKDTTDNTEFIFQSDTVGIRLGGAAELLAGLSILACAMIAF